MKLYRHPLVQGRKGQEAFTLIETIMAVLVVMVAFSAIFSTMLFGLQVTQTTRENLRATQIMLDKMEGVRLYSWSELTNSSFLLPAFTNWFFETNNIGATNAIGNGVKYTGTISITNVSGMPDSYSGCIRAVTVTVTWKSDGWLSSQPTHTRSMCTFVSQFGMQNYIYND